MFSKSPLMDVRVPRVILSIALAALLPVSTAKYGSREEGAKNRGDVPHSRQKRILWITNDGRLALPPGATMIITPSLSMPFVRHPPEGFFSNISVSLPFTIDFDKLGLTDNENPYGELPPIFARSLGRAAGSVMADYVSQYLDKRRGKRSAGESYPPQVESFILQKMHGGERALLYPAVEDMLANFGMSGKACLLRAICETHAHPLTHYGFIGEVMKLFLAASRSPYSEVMSEYVAAEKAGEVDGECWPYFKECPKSLFLPPDNKYSKGAQTHHEEDNEIEEDAISDKTKQYPSNYKFAQPM